MSLKDLVFHGHLDEDEKILAVAHRHPFILCKDSFKTFFIGLILPLVFYAFFPQIYFVMVGWAVLGVVGMIYHFVDWYFDAFLITNVGIIDIERNGLFDRSSTRVEYHMIEGISYTIKGVMATILRFGDITIDKIGTQTSVLLKDCSHPKSIERLIMKHQADFVGDKSYRDHNTLKDMLSEMIAYHVQNDKIKPPKR